MTVKNILPPPPPPPPPRMVKYWPFCGDIETKESKQATADWYKTIKEWRKMTENFSERIKKDDNG